MMNGNTKNLEPDNFVLDQDIEIVMLNIFNRAKRNEKIQSSIDDKLSKLLDLNVSLINVNIENQKILNSLVEKNGLKESRQISKQISKQESKESKFSTTIDKSLSLQECVPPECSFSVDVVQQQSKTIDDLFNQFSQLIDVTKQNQISLNKISNQTSIVSDGINKSVDLIDKSDDLIGKNQISLDNILEVNNNMTNQIGKLLDVGGNITVQGEVKSTEFTVINTIESPGHPVKGMVVRNSCDSTIFVGVNVAESSIGPDIIDTISDDSRFTQVLVDENFPMDYNTQSIKNIWILSKKDKGKDTTAKFRCLLTW